MANLVQLLCAETGLPPSDIARVLDTAPRRYKVFNIPKRDGSMREIAQPSRELKVLQRAFDDAVLSKLPVHKCATAYREGLSIRHNALVHAGRSELLKLDFEDFFPSIHEVDWFRYCNLNGLFPDCTDRVLTAKLLFRRKKGDRTLRLSIGAPSSPSLSNILMYNFDEIVAIKARSKGISYSRYADDLTFSGQRLGMLADMIEVVKTAVKASSGPRLHLKQEKTKFISTKFSRRVTGLVLTNDGDVGIGRAKRRKLRAWVHRFLTVGLPADDRAKLSGYLAFVNSVEPDFLDVLNRYYGVDVIEAVRGKDVVNPATS